MVENKTVPALQDFIIYLFKDSVLVFYYCVKIITTKSATWNNADLLAHSSVG